MIQKLNIVDGIIQDKFIDGIPVKLAIIEPSGNANVRILIPMTQIIGITNHNTGNSSPGATAESHAKYFQNVENADQNYVSAHLFVDCDCIIQILPLNEIAYHAGDGKGNGNYHTLSIEICENKNNEVAEDNAKK
jgi:N-acetylmuramoyl-L-alanine amidase